jgi:hypothetical protein
MHSSINGTYCFFVSSGSYVFRELGKFLVDEITDRRGIALPNYDDVANRDVVVIDFGSCHSVEMGFDKFKTVKYLEKRQHTFHGI